MSSSLTAASDASGSADPVSAHEREATDSEQPPRVHLTIPATARYLRLARLTAAGLAGDLGFPVDAIEDLRIAVDELCAAIIDGVPATASLDLVYQEAGGGLQVEGRCQGGQGSLPELHGVARELLDMLADEYQLHAADGAHTFRLLKYASGPDESSPAPGAPG
jgi:serine/threonine-protein kinase RsbW